MCRLHRYVGVDRFSRGEDRPSGVKRVFLARKLFKLPKKPKKLEESASDGEIFHFSPLFTITSIRSGSECTKRALENEKEILRGRETLRGRK